MAPVKQSKFSRIAQRWGGCEVPACHAAVDVQARNPDARVSIAGHKPEYRCQRWA